jgi:uncharacterized protein YcnI
VRLRLPLAVTALAFLAAVVAAAASAHAHLSPPVALAKAGQMFSLAVPTEKESASTVKVVLTVPDGFAIDSFVPASGWTREVQATGSGDREPERDADHGDQRERRSAGGVRQRVVDQRVRERAARQHDQRDGGGGAHLRSR